MRIRSTKPEFWRSERVASVSWDARLVLKGLESFVDDNGVGKDDLALIVADVFPRDLSRNPTGTLRKVSEALDHLSSAGLLWRYEADGTKFLYVAFWESIQRIEKPTRGRFPRPDGTMNYRDSLIREPSRNPPGTLLEPSGLEQGNRGTGEQGNRHAPRLSTESSEQPRGAHDDEPELETVSPETVYPRGFVADTRHKAYAMEKGLDVGDELDAFRDHAKANGRTAVDWAAAFSGWLRNSAKRKTEKPGSDRRVNVGNQEWMLR